MKIFRILLGLCLLLAVVAGGLGYYLYSELNTRVTHQQSDQYITIAYGSAPGQIIEVLEQNNIVNSALPLKIYFRLVNRNPNLQAGDYLFPSPISPLEAMDILKAGKKRTKGLTIPEGWTRFEIAERIARQFPSQGFQRKEEVLALMNNTDLIKSIDPTAENLEGYLYPTTYQFPEDATAEDIVFRMVAQFKDIWQPEWDALATKLNKSKKEIVTIASLIENESKIDSERPLVASVIYNRLEKGIPLGLDATNVYIAKLQDRWDGTIHKSDLEVDHPYNTRKVRGIPPGPISSPSKTAIEAALQPAKTDYIYYVLNVEKSDGSHHFYATSDGFLRGKSAYQKWLKAQRK